MGRLIAWVVALVFATASAAQADPLSTLFANTLAGWGVGAQLATVAGQLLTSTLLSSLSKALGPGRNAGENVGRELSLPTSLPVYRFVYGDCWAVGTPAPVRVKGGGIYACWILNSRPSEGPFTVLLDKRPLVLTGDPYDFAGPGAVPTNSYFPGYVRIWIGRGDQTSAPDDIVAEAPLLFSAADAWRGRTVVWMVLGCGPNEERSVRWPSSPPEIILEGKWSKVWDPRDPAQDPDDPATWEYSANQGLVVLDALRQSPLTPYDLRNLWLDTFKWAADVAGEAVAVKAGGTIPRYEVNGTLAFATGVELEDQLQPLLAAGASEFVRPAGQLGIVPATAQTPTVTLTDMLDGTAPKFRRYAPKSELATTVAAKYLAPDRAYEQTDGPTYIIPGALAEDGGFEKLIQPDLSLVTDHRQVQRLQKIAGLRARMQRQVEAEFPPAAFKLIAGSWFNLNLPAPYTAWNRTYQVLNHDPQLALEDQGGVSMRCQMAVREVDASIYAWNAATEEQDVEAYTFAPDIAEIAPPGIITVTTGYGIDLNTGGTVIPRLKFSFAPSTSVGAQNYEWEYRISGESWIAGGVIRDSIFDGPGDVSQFMMASIGVSYDIRVRAVIGSAASAWVQATGVTVSFVITGGAAVADYAAVVFTGIAPASLNFAGFKTYRGATNVFSAASEIGAQVAGTPGAAYSVRVGPASVTNMLVNGTFDADANWTKGTGWTIAAGIASKSAGTGSRLAQTVTMTAGVSYRIGGDVIRTAGTITPEILGATNVAGTAVSATGKLFSTVAAPTSPTTVRFLGDFAFAGSIDNAVMFVSAAGQVAQGVGYFWIVPISATGLPGTPDGPYQLTII